MIKTDPILNRIRDYVDEEVKFKHKYPNFIPVCTSLVAAIKALDEIQASGREDAVVASDALLQIKTRIMGRNKRT